VLIIVAVILLLVYRSPVLWLLPLAGAVAAVIVARAFSHGLANAGLTVTALSSDIVIVLVFGAASDYALLLVHWYREELRHRAATEAAMAVTPGKIDIDALRAQQAIVETAALLYRADVYRRHRRSGHRLGPHAPRCADR
jgi:urea transporter